MRKFIIFFIFFLILGFNTKCFSFDDEETLIIFDASSSMGEEVRGSKKYVFAVKAAKNILENMSSHQKIGLRIIGVELNSSIVTLLKNPKELCKQTRLAAPISENNVYNINKHLDLITPLGVTPLTYALKSAIENDFSNYYNTLKHIILITDGGESCGGNPCALLRQIASDRNDIKVDIIAIKVDRDEYIQLNCIAEVTGGSVKNVSSPSDFEMALSSVIEYKPTKLDTVNNVISPSSIKINSPLDVQQDTIYKNYTFEFDN